MKIKLLLSFVLLLIVANFSYSQVIIQPISAKTEVKTTSKNHYRGFMEIGGLVSTKSRGGLA